MLSSAAVRATCRRCLRPEDGCLCRELPVLETRTRVVLLQHPREARLAICSAWLTRIALARAELHRGFRFGEHPRVKAVVEAPGTWLLFPGPGSRTWEAVAASPPATLIVVDGTWIQAEKLLAANPAIAALPRLEVRPAVPSGYRDLRREPAPGCLPTVEAVALALGELEGDHARFEPMRVAFRRMVDRQLAYSTGPRRSPRHRPGWGGARPPEASADAAAPVAEGERDGAELDGRDERDAP